MEHMKMGATQNVYIVWMWLSANFWMELVHTDVNQGIEVLNAIRNVNPIPLEPTVAWFVDIVLEKNDVIIFLETVEVDVIEGFRGRSAIQNVKTKSMEETAIDHVEIVWTKHSATRFMDIVWMDVPLALRFQDAKDVL